MTMYAMDCAAFDERLADYLEGDLDSAARREVEAHVGSCVRCSALLRDLEHIRASAAELPELTPSTDLWGGIARRIDTPVLPLTRPAPNVVAGRRNFDWVRRAAVAAALVAVTAGVTYTLTVAHGPRAATQNIASNRPTSPDSNVRPTTDTANRQLVPPTSGTTNPQDTELVSPPTQQVSATESYSREIDRLRTLALLVRLNFKLDALSLGQRLQAGVLDRGDVYEHITAAVVRLDEAVAALAVEEFDRTTHGHLTDSFPP